MTEKELCRKGRVLFFVGSILDAGIWQNPVKTIEGEERAGNRYGWLLTGK